MLGQVDFSDIAILCNRQIIVVDKILTLFGLEGGKAKWPPEGFSKYLKNGLTDLHQTF